MAAHRVRLVGLPRRPGTEPEGGLAARAQGSVVSIEGLRDAEAILLAHTAAKAGLQAERTGRRVTLLGSADQFAAFPEVLAAESESLVAPGEEVLAALERARIREFRVPLAGGGELVLGGRTLVMGVVNVTPNSFSDGGEFLDTEAAVARGLELVREGADVIDVGGESTRPGAEPVSPEEEAGRVLPVIQRLADEAGVPVSVDTRRGATAREALKAGARMVNDVSGLADPVMAAVAAHAGAPVILMHMRGTPADMRSNPEWTAYEDLVGEVLDELSASVRRAIDAGVPESGILIDPGIGFAKTGPQSLELIRRLAELRVLGRPIVVGPSRKSFLTEIEDVPPGERLHLTLGAVTACVANGAHLVRVHDVGPAVQAIRAFESTYA